MKGTTALAAPTLKLLLADVAAGVPVAPAQALERWLERLSEHTRRAYAADLKDLANRCGISEPELVKQLVLSGPAGTNALLDGWLAELRHEGLSTATRARRLSSVRALLRFLRLVGVISWTVEIRSDRVENEDMRGPTPAQWQSVLAKVDSIPDAWMRTRTKALVYLLGVCGLRIGEVLHMRIPEDLGDQRIRIIGKGHTAAEWVRLPKVVNEAIQNWIVWRGPRPGALFVSRAIQEPCEPLAHSSIYRQLMRLGHQIDAQLAVRPHGLRHRAVTAALDATGGDLRRVMKFSRHQSVVTVLRYDDDRRGEQVAAEIADLVADVI